MKTLLRRGAAVAVLALGCSETTSSDVAAIETAQSSHARSPASSPAADFAALRLGNTAFALDLHRAVAPPNGNSVLSPYSVSTALAMTYAGARSTSATQLATALHFTLEPTALHAAFNALDHDLAARTARAAATDNPRPMQLQVVNSLWSQRGATLLTPFLETLAEDYGAGVRLLDFHATPEPSRLAINHWVSDQTSGRITNLLGEGSITTATRLVLTNTVHFLAGWSRPFYPEQTAPAAFHRLDGTTVTTPTMNAWDLMQYSEGPNWQSVSLGYQGAQSSMLLVVPAAGHFAEVEAALTAEQLDAMVAAQREFQVRLAWPKFSFRTHASLVTALRAMGANAPFDATAADFSGITGAPDLYLDDVAHEAVIAVDEVGTEASAATVVVFTPTSLPPQATLTVDRPFLFFIRSENGTVLFVGRVTDPTAG